MSRPWGRLAATGSVLVLVGAAGYGVGISGDPEPAPTVTMTPEPPSVTYGARLGPSEGGFRVEFPDPGNGALGDGVFTVGGGAGAEPGRWSAVARSDSHDCVWQRVVLTDDGRSLIFADGVIEPGQGATTVEIEVTDARFVSYGCLWTKL